MRTCCENFGEVFAIIDTCIYRCLELRCFFFVCQRDFNKAPDNMENLRFSILFVEVKNNRDIIFFIAC